MPFLSTPPLPNCKVEIAFDSGFATPEDSRTWTDVSAWVEGDQSVDITYGRADELSTPDPNTLSVTLDNRDGRFSPGKASSPYFPNVKKGKPIRVSVTYAGVSYVRFTGYVNAWPLVWPDGSSAASTVTITASSRRARLGQTAPLTSAIRAAYLATSPNAYWPMDEDAETALASTGQQVFRDITNTALPGLRETQLLAAWSPGGASLTPVVRDGTAGPTDEQSLVRFPAFTNGALIATFPHSVGAGNAVVVPPAGGLTIECVARVSALADGLSAAALIDFRSTDLNDAIRVTVGNDGAYGFGYVSTEIVKRDQTTGAILDDHSSAAFPNPYNNDDFLSATDGGIHHFLVTLSSSKTTKFYFDGTLIATLTLAVPYTFTQNFTLIALGADTWNSTAWIGHAAVHDRALTAAEVLTRAQAATAASETPGERVVRLAGRLGVPAGEVDVETSIAAPLGPQSEAGRTAVDVIDELAESTAGIAYDTRAGHIALQSRNHRYNATSAFSLSAVTQEIQGDLTAVADDRYLVNTVEFSRAGTDNVPATVVDDASVDAYGIYTKTLSVVSTSDEEVQAAAQDQLYRFAEPRTRISAVSVDIPNVPDSQRAAVLAADIGTLFAIASLPVQAPTDPMPLFYEGATESITATSHIITINTTPGDVYQSVLIWDDPVFGKWDSGNVWAY